MQITEGVPVRASRGCLRLDRRSRRMQATTVLASRLISWFRTHRGRSCEAAMVAVGKRKDIIMNANPASAASVAPALQSAAVRAPERVRLATALETFDVYRVSLDA